MIVGGHDTARDVLVVAEIGNNHEGDAGRARALVHAAAASGAGAVKVQVFRTQHFVRPADLARYEQLAGFELPYDTFGELQQLAKSLGLLFIATPLDLPSAEFLANIVDCYKVASGDNDFYPLIARICATALPVLLSSGASDYDRIAASRRFVAEEWRRRGIRQDVGVLHCVSSYPAPPEQANLAAIGHLAERLGGTIGYSDHTLGIETAILSVAAGARIVEKHFTLDKQQSAFRDHQLSATPDEMMTLVREVARVSRIVGTAGKSLQPCERELAPKLRRSIVAAGDLPRGHRVRPEDLTWMRPADGLRPGDEPALVGRMLRRAVAHGEPILATDVEEAR
jgi:N,N'-diacetyllegionaminate synthase